ncbi:hypothetical protein E2562_031417 [Oryza meyeriana var. granulata]|uniref:Uncharacterized protein n=1 Tax=Oryza meyeriana var. granulata TaxID=110450 RepID=A0A6G1C144_9ORYZ|nr:hypothetical protein E2562_031417 [Oryza meyeriana var. granulata]
MEMESSQCSSGCQSGWTLYLDHYSNGGADHHRQCCSPPCKNNEVDDSMVSDASSGPPPHLHDVDDEDEELRDQTRRRRQQRRHRHHLLGCHADYDDSGSSGGSRSVGFGSSAAWSMSSHGLAEAKRSRRKRRAIAGDDVNPAVVLVLRHRDHDSGDDLDDTASSSAVSSLQPGSCAFSARHLQQWSSAVQGTTILQTGDANAMLHRNIRN